MGKYSPPPNFRKASLGNVSGMDFRQRYGPWALITGASAGLGACYAHALGARGLGLVLVARRQQRMEALAEKIRGEHAVQVCCIGLDLTAEGAVEQLCEELAGKELGLLVNNAGFGHVGPFLDQEPAALRQMVRLNCEIPAMLAHSLLPAMRSRGHGGMLVLASAAGYQPTPWMSAYGASKGFDLLWSEGVAVELAKDGVDVLAVSPGHTDTEFHRVAGVEGAVIGGSARPEDVVEQSLRFLGKRISFVHGRLNYWSTWSARLFPRRLVAKMVGRLLKNR